MIQGPSRADGAGDGDGCSADVGTCFCFAIHRRGKLPLRVQHVDQAHGSGAIGGLQSADGLFERPDRCANRVQLGAAFAPGRTGVLDILGCAQHGQAIGGKQFCLTTPRCGNLCVDAAEVE